MYLYLEIGPSKRWSSRNEITKVGPNPTTGILLKGGRLYTQIPGSCVPREKTLWAHREKVAIYKPRREALGETNHADTLILDFWLPELWKIHFCFCGERESAREEGGRGGQRIRRSGFHTDRLMASPQIMICDLWWPHHKLMTWVEVRPSSDWTTQVPLYFYSLSPPTFLVLFSMAAQVN